MNGWSLDQVRDLDEDEYDVLVQWLVKQSERTHSEDSIDVDALAESERATALRKAMRG